MQVDHPQAFLFEDLAEGFPVKFVAHAFHVLQFIFTGATWDVFDEEEDHEGQNDPQRTGDDENVLPTTQGSREQEGNDHTDQITDGLGELQNTVHFAANFGGIEVRDQTVHTGVTGIVNTGRGTGDHKIREARRGVEPWGESAEPGGGAPDEGGGCQQLSAVIFVAQPAPQWVEERSDDKSAGVNETPLRIAHVEGFHDVGLQRADE
ncbi:hypothetical protein SDC9_114038 [bioreactor metagenome]|uniref:Uncharacterized protein n=1 Tax=bioreactor metagenome TaxID=1076179 RepID=A0A645BR87_9ZZZZ